MEQHLSFSKVLCISVENGFCHVYVETVFLYPWAMSFNVLGVSVFIEAYERIS